MVKIHSFPDILTGNQYSVTVIRWCWEVISFDTPARRLRQSLRTNTSDLNTEKQKESNGGTNKQNGEKTEKREQEVGKKKIRKQDVSFGAEKKKKIKKI